MRPILFNTDMVRAILSGIYPVFDAIRKEMEEENEGIQGIQ